MINVAEDARVNLVVAKEQPDPINELVLRYYLAWIEWVFESKWSKETPLTLEQWFIAQGL